MNPSHTLHAADIKSVRHEGLTHVLDRQCQLVLVTAFEEHRTSQTDRRIKAESNEEVWLKFNDEE
jgi:hypothetical protein